MSEVKWCDLGQHAYPRGQAGSTTMTVQQQVKNQWGGWQPENETADVCAACANDAGIGQMSDTIHTTQSPEEAYAQAAAIRDGRFKSPLLKVKRAITGQTADGSVHDPEEARAKGYDPDYVKWLQDQADQAEAEANDGFADLPPRS